MGRRSIQELRMMTGQWFMERGQGKIFFFFFLNGANRPYLACQ